MATNQLTLYCCITNIKSTVFVCQFIQRCNTLCNIQGTPRYVRTCMFCSLSTLQIRGFHLKTIRTANKYGSANAFITPLTCLQKSDVLFHYVASSAFNYAMQLFLIGGETKVCVVLSSLCHKPPEIQQAPHIRLF